MPKTNSLSLVSILIVTWNSAAHLSHCLARLAEQTHKDFEIIIVDNGSTDNSLSRIEKKYPMLTMHIKLLKSNLGFAAANNIGAYLARGKWLALLNADAFPDSDWLEHLVAAAAIYPGAFFTSRQIQADNPQYLDGEGDAYHISGLAWRRNYGLPQKEKKNVEETFSSCAAAALYPRQAFLDLGGFDQDYFSYFEDVDLGFRLRLNGYRCFYIPEAVVRHVGSASTGKRSGFSIYYGYRNLIWTFIKNMPSSLFWFYLPLHSCVILFFAVHLTLRGQGSFIFKAILDAIRGLPLILAKRKIIQGNIKIKPRDLLDVMSTSIFEPYHEFILRNRNK